VNCAVSRDSRDQKNTDIWVTEENKKNLRRQGESTLGDDGGFPTLDVLRLLRLICGGRI